MNTRHTVTPKQGVDSLKLTPCFSTFLMVLSFLIGVSISSAQDNEEIAELNPFEINEELSDGYYSKSTTAGSRFALPITDIPQTVTVINQEMIEDLNAWDPQRVLEVGASGIARNNVGWIDLQIRGFRQNGQFRDGQSWTGSSGIVPMYDIDRLEVVKGPSALTFGDPGVLGGVVNFVAKKPTLKPAGSAKFTYGPDTNFMRGELNASGPLAPLVGNESANQFLRENKIRYRTTLGFQEDDRERANDFDNNTFLSGAISGDFANTTVNLEYYKYKANKYVKPIDFIDMEAPSPGPIQLHPNSTLDFLTSGVDAPLNNDIDQNYFKGEIITRMTQNQSIKFLYRYYGNKSRRRYLRSFTMQPDNITLNRQDLVQALDTDNVLASLDYLLNVQTGWFGGITANHTFSAGFQYNDDDSGSRSRTLALPPLDTNNPDYSNDSIDQRPPVSEIEWLNRDIRTLSKETSWYAQLIAELWGPKLLGVYGSRWIGGEATNINFNSPEDEQGSYEKTDRRRVYRAGLVYKPLPDLSFFLSKGTTFSINNSLDHLGNPLVDSEGINEEIGVKFADYQLPNGASLFGSASFFKLELTNVRVVFTDNQGNAIISQDAKNSNEGIEVELGYRQRMGPGNFTGFLALYSADPQDSDGNQSIESSEQIYSLMLRYGFDEGMFENLTLGGSMSYESDRPTRVTGNTGYYIEGFSIYNAFARYQFNDKWYASVHMSNITDEQNIIRANNTGLASKRDGRRTEFSVGYKW